MISIETIKWSIALIIIDLMIFIPAASNIMHKKWPEFEQRRRYITFIMLLTGIIVFLFALFSPFVIQSRDLRTTIVGVIMFIALIMAIIVFYWFRKDE